MTTTFREKRRTILAQLDTPDGDYQDASPKGSVDVEILDLVKTINQYQSLVTTSSCSGRFVLYLDGVRSSDDQTGGKGGGEWLYVNHQPVKTDMDLKAMLDSSGYRIARSSQTLPESTAGVRLLHCKFEPMIIHILAETLSEANKVLIAAHTAGFRESGVSSLPSDEKHSGDGVMIGVRTNGLAFDSVIGFEAAERTITPLVSDDYLHLLVDIANRRFTANKDRTDRFQEALIQRMSAKGRESKADRAARMRAEGLKHKKSAGTQPDDDWLDNTPQHQDGEG